MLILAIPLAVYFAVGKKPTPTIPTPTPTAPVTAAPSPTGGRPTTVPTGVIARAELFNSTFDIPAWPADSPIKASTRRLKFTNGRTAETWEHY